MVAKRRQADDAIYTPYRVAPDTKVKLAKIDPDETGSIEGKGDAKKALKVERKRLRLLQERLYAEGQQSLLVVLQATDTGGKDGTIEHVFGGSVNPQGCVVTSFKQPSAEELAHDFLWRIHKHTPARGMIGIFNRSHYEDVLVVRVKKLVPEAVWRPRYERINEFERNLIAAGTRILKIFLHISKDEQKARLESRLADPEKQWKFAIGDLKERESWDNYQAAFEEMFQRCSTQEAPWYLIPANHKWYRNLVVARLVADTLEAMDPHFPPAEAGLDQVVIPE